MKPTNADLNSRRAQRPRNIHRPRKLIRLHANQRDQSRLFAKFARNAIRPDMRISFVQRLDDDVDVIPQHAPLLAVERKAIDHRQRVRRNRRPQPLDDVAVIVVVRWFDQNQRKALPRSLVSPHNNAPRIAPASTPIDGEVYESKAPVGYRNLRAIETSLSKGMPRAAQRVEASSIQYSRRAFNTRCGRSLVSTCNACRPGVAEVGRKLST